MGLLHGVFLGPCEENPPIRKSRISQAIALGWRLESMATTMALMEACTVECRGDTWSGARILNQGHALNRVSITVLPD